jgi:hypothetical protein
VPSLAFAPDGRTLLVGRLTGAVELWEVASGGLRHRFAGHLEPVHAVAFSPDGRTVASASADTTALLWHVSGSAGAPRQGRLSDAELERHWFDLLGQDAARAHRAIWRLVAAPAQAVGYARERSRPGEALPHARLRKLVAALGDSKFRVREKARAELESLGELAVPALREALADKPDVEVARQVSRLLQRLEEPGELPAALRLGRVVEVLEQTGTREARELLATLAARAPGSLLSQAARAAVKRLPRGSP